VRATVSYDFVITSDYFAPITEISPSVLNVGKLCTKKLEGFFPNYLSYVLDVLSLESVLNVNGRPVSLTKAKGTKGTRRRLKPFELTGSKELFEGLSSESSE